MTIDAADPSPDPGDGIRIFDVTDPTFGADSPLVTLKGLTLRGGDPLDGFGGAIRSAARLDVRQCTFIDNEAALSGGAIYATAQLDVVDSKFQGNATSGLGGALYLNLLDESATITRSELSSNRSAADGGAVHGFLMRSDLAVVDSAFSDNAAAGGGGAVQAHLSDRSSLDVDDCTFTINRSEADGGALAVRLDDSSFVLNRSVVHGNRSEGDGGGVFAKTVAPGVNPFPTPRAITIAKSVISGNTAQSRGGGVYSYNTTATEGLIEDSRITGNVVPQDSQSAFRNGGGVYAYVVSPHTGENKPTFTIARSTIDNNQADHEGGGVFVCSKDSGNVVFLQSTISGNQTLDPVTGAGGGLFIAHVDNPVASVDAYLRNTTVTQNISPSGGGLATANLDRVRVRIANSIVSANFDRVGPGQAPSNVAGRLDAANTKFNLVGSGSTILALDGSPGTLDSTNLLHNNAPQLTPLSDFGGPTPTHALQFGSPAIDAGSNALATHPLTGEALAADQRGPGFTRPFDVAAVNHPGRGPVDIGAYEVNLPKVISVVVDGSASAHEPYDFSTALHEGEPVVGGGNQLRTIPVGRADRIAVRFSEDVPNVSSGSLTLRALTTGALQTLAQSGGFAYDPLAHAATWKFSAPFPADQLLITLADTVTSSWGDALDGEWVNP
ncbi:MAG: hypothetical protein DCC68_26880, partial [Planctomycetota bacterium]